MKITLDVANSEFVSFDKVKDMVLKHETIETEKRFQFVWDQETKQIKTIWMSRKIQPTIHTKRCVDGMDTKPYGYVYNLMEWFQRNKLKTNTII